MSKIKDLYNNHKKDFILFLVAIISFLFLIIGATYAYFLSNVFDYSTIANYDLEFGEKLKIISTGKADLSINLNLDNMKRFANNKIYYASSSGTTEINPNEVLATFANVSSSDGYCDYSIELTKEVVNGKSDLLTNIINNGSANEVLLKTRDDSGILSTTDLKDVTWTDNKTTITGTIENLTRGEKDLYIDFIINNLSSVNQAPYLAGAANKITAEISSLDCHANNSNTAFVYITPDYLQKTITLKKINTRLHQASSYCINTTRNNYSGCTWKNFSSNIMTETMSENILYFVYLKDVNNNVTYQRVDLSTPTNLSEYLINRNLLAQTNYENDGYRFVTVVNNIDPNNYLCFGTTNRKECLDNPNKYLYQIIGVFNDSDNNKHVKLIKYKALSSKYIWSYDSSSMCYWRNSSLYTSLNGNVFLTNYNYEYMQKSKWLNKIENWNWISANSQVNINANALNYRLVDTQGVTETVQDVYLHEMNRSTNTHIGLWSTNIAKIGLLYVSDYYLALYFSYNNKIDSNDYEQSHYKSWIAFSYLNLVDERSHYDQEWTMTQAGKDEYNNNYSAYIVDSFPSIEIGEYDNSYYVRPVFYLTSNVERGAGEGTLTNPYMIK